MVPRLYIGTGLVIGALALIAGGAAALAGGPDDFGYAFKDSASTGGPAYNFIDISLNGTNLAGFPCDDCLATVNIGFPFQFYGGSSLGQATQVNVSSNGFLTFSGGQSNGCCSGQAIPNPASPNNIVAAYWEDLNPNAGGLVKSAVLGSAPNRTFVVMFSNVPHYPSGNLTSFEYKLFENTKNIEVHYKSVTSDGGTHSAGIENVTGYSPGGGLQYRFGSFSIANTAVRYAFLEPDVDISLSGTAGGLGWFRSAVTVSLSCTPPLGATCAQIQNRVDLVDPSPYSVYGGPYSVSADGLHHVDFYGISSYGTQNPPETQDFRIDKTAPGISLVATCTAAVVNGFCTGQEKVVASATDATSGLRIGYPTCTLDGAVSACGTVFVATTGAHTFAVTAQDVAGNTATTSTSFTVDSTPPVLALTPICSVPGDNGWCRGQVTVTTSASDSPAGLAVGSPTCKRDGASVACGSIVVTGDGNHLVQISATDRAGNAATLSLSIQIDATAPTGSIGGSCSVPGLAGWCRGSVTLVVTQADATSGVAGSECTLDDVVLDCAGAVTDDGTPVAAVTVRDIAGNTATFTTTIRIDQTPPDPTATTNCAKTGTSGWCRAPAYDYQGKATDGGSGVATLSCRADTLPAACTATLTGEGLHVVEVSATDVAGNDATSYLYLAIDSVAPTVGAVPDCPSPGNAGWCRGPVSFAVSGGDDTSGLQSLSCRVDTQPADCAAAVTAQGAHTFRATARDQAGNTASVEVPAQIDAVPPTAQAQATCALPGDAGWCRGTVHVVGASSDAGSGIGNAQCLLDGFPVACTGADVTIQGSHTFSIAVTDVAGNTANDAALFKVDSIESTGVLSMPLVSAGVFSVTWTASDGGSGLARVEIQRRPLLEVVGDAWTVACGEDFGGTAFASGSCAQSLSPGAVCYRIVVTDQAGNVFIGRQLDLLDLSRTPPGVRPFCGVIA